MRFSHRQSFFHDICLGIFLWLNCVPLFAVLNTSDLNIKIDDYDDAKNNFNGDVIIDLLLFLKCDPSNGYENLMEQYVNYFTPNRDTLWREKVDSLKFFSTCAKERKNSIILLVFERLRKILSEAQENNKLILVKEKGTFEINGKEWFGALIEYILGKTELEKGILKFDNNIEKYKELSKSDTNRAIKDHFDLLVSIVLEIPIFLDLNFLEYKISTFGNLEKEIKHKDKNLPFLIEDQRSKKKGKGACNIQ